MKSKSEFIDAFMNRSMGRVKSLPYCTEWLIKRDEAMERAEKAWLKYKKNETHPRKQR
jgi:hypothetical protein